MVNLKVRAKNKVFWLAIIPAILVLVKQVAITFFQKDVDISGLSNQLQQIIETVFLILGIMGIVVDPTTDGLKDSKRAMGYVTPRKDEE